MLRAVFTSLLTLHFQCIGRSRGDIIWDAHACPLRIKKMKQSIKIARSARLQLHFNIVYSQGH